jgi:acetylornithine deacetylase/succinyl-diaminopimelate desuccinylase-like protein
MVRTSMAERFWIAVAIVFGFVLCVPGLRAQQGTSDSDRLGREILQELIETNTTHSTGSTTIAAERIAARFRSAGFPAADVMVLGSADKKGNLVVRYRSPSRVRKPVLLLAHLDVVEARREDWSFDPFTLLEQEGYFYGRGTLDVKGGAATLVAALLRLRKEGFTPDRDLVLALTADEEGGDDNGVRWLLANRRDLIDAAYCVNVDSGGGELRNGKLVAFDVQASEKVFVSFTLTVHNPGGHSSLPVKDNAIYRLAAGLGRLSTFQFPIRTNEITRAYFNRMADIVGGAEAADLRGVASQPPAPAAIDRVSASSPFRNALLRTTCVATMLQAGHAENALPQTAQATVNCRMLPDDNEAAVKQTLERVIADPEFAIVPIRPSVPSPPSALARDVFQSVETTVKGMWGAVPVVPFMETGATDGLFLRNAGIPVYGLTGIAYDVNDVRAHGKDERIVVRAYYEGLEFMYRFVKSISGGS